MKESKEKKSSRRPTRFSAVALGYDPDQDRAPRVLATGKDEMAQKILALAQKHHIPIHQDAVLAEKLTSLDLNAEIPAELYQVVAELLVFLYRLDNRWQAKKNKG